MPANMDRYGATAPLCDNDKIYRKIQNVTTAEERKYYDLAGGDLTKHDIPS